VRNRTRNEPQRRPPLLRCGDGAARYFDHYDEEIAHMDVAVGRLLDGCVE
jgi:hypothetical protein